MRQQPNDLNAEAAILSAMMINGKAANKAISLLNKKDFYRTTHQIIFNAMTELSHKNIEIDLITVINYLETTNKLRKVGGKLFLNELSDVALSSANIGYHAKLIKDKAILRKAIESGSKMVNSCYTGVDDVEKFINDSQAELSKLQIKQVDIGTPLATNERALSELEELRQNPEHKLIKSDIGSLDNIVQMRAGSLIIIKSDKSVGKTVLGNQIAFQNIAYRDKVGLIITGEMDESELLYREYARQSGIPAYRFFKGRISDNEMTKISERADMLSDKRYRIYPYSASIQKIRAEAQDLIQEYGQLDFILIDYLQIMQMDKAEKRERELANFTAASKRLAKEFNIPVIELSQVNSDGQARESRAISHDADIVMHIRRPHAEKLDMWTNSAGIKIKSEPQHTLLHIDKNRKGKKSVLELSFNGDRQLFEEAE